MRRPDGIRWLAPAPGSGFGDAAQAYLTGLRACGVPVTWTPMGWPSPVWGSRLGPVDASVADGHRHRDVAGAAVDHDTVVVQGTPLWHPRLAEEAAGRRLVACTAWETDRVGAADLAVLDRYDLVLVPSAANAATLVRSGISVPVVAVPHIAVPPAAVPPAAGSPTGRSPAAPGDPGPGAPAPTDGTQGTGTVFYTLGPWTSRKAIPDLVRAYLAAFTAADPVRLVIHTSAEDLVAWRRVGAWPPGPHGAGDARLTTWYSLARLLAGRTGTPAITLSTRVLPAAEVGRLHDRGDCFVSLSRGEGWGLGAFDAAARGNPVVVTGWGAATEFLPAGYPYLVRCDLVPTTVDEADAWWEPDPSQRWAQADVEHAAALLRRVADHGAEARSWGSVAAAWVRARYGEDRVTARLLDALVAARPATGRR